MENNDFITSAENIYTGDAYISNLISKLDPTKFAPVNKDLVGKPIPEGIYNEETGKIQGPEVKDPVSQKPEDEAAASE